MIKKWVCEYCGKAFQAQRATRKTCSEPCRAKLNARKRRMAAAGVDPDSANAEVGPFFVFMATCPNGQLSRTGWPRSLSGH
jgi:hypothetical protein